MEQVWSFLRHSRRGRLLAGALIAASFGVLAAVEVTATMAAVCSTALGGAAMGVLAVGLLEWLDWLRSRKPERRCGVKHTADLIQRDNPETPPALGQTGAQEHEAQRLTPLEWCGVILGGLCALCGLAVLITWVIQFLRNW